MIVCLYDGCCEFEPNQHNHVYCNDHKCKRKEENRKKRLESPLKYDDETFELQEKRKRALLQRKDARNEWIKQNKTFASFDIETTDLKADGGQILCASIKPLNGPVETYKSEIYLPEGGDDKWLSQVGDWRWIVISQDYHFHDRENERYALKQHGVGCFYLWGAEATKWETMRCFARAYDKVIQAAETTPRPFIFWVSKTGITTQQPIP